MQLKGKICFSVRANTACLLALASSAASRQAGGGGHVDLSKQASSVCLQKPTTDLMVALSTVTRLCEASGGQCQASIWIPL